MRHLDRIRAYALSLPYATEDMPFGPEVLVFRVLGKIFLLVWLDEGEEGPYAVKCEPDFGEELRVRFPVLQPAYHMNKRHWMQFRLGTGAPSSELITQLIQHSYYCVVQKLPTRRKILHPEVFTVDRPPYSF